MMGAVRSSLAMLQFALIVDFPHPRAWVAVAFSGAGR